MQAPSTTLSPPRSIRPAPLLLVAAAIVVVAVGLLALTVLQTVAVERVVGPSQGGSEIAVEAGSRLTVALPANPSTGYGWVITTIDPTRLVQIGGATFVPDSELMGAGGTSTFEFEATGPGRAVLELAYLRSWEEAEPLDTFAIAVDVR